MDWVDVLAHCSSVGTPLQEGAAVVRRPPGAPDAVQQAAGVVGELPEEYQQLLEISDGVILFPKRPGNEGGIAICSLSQLVQRTRFAYPEHDPDDPGPDRRPFFVVGFTVGEGGFIGVAPDGSVSYLDHEYSFLEWAEGKGVVRLAGSLREFALTLAAHLGRWWWQSHE